MSYLIGGGGGPGGPVCTEVVVGTLTTGDLPIEMNHPAVPLTGPGSGGIMWTATASYPGTEHISAGGVDWPAEDLNVNGATWENDGVGIGHFSVNPGPKCGIGMALDDPSSNAITTNWPADPTVEGSVTLTQDYATTLVPVTLRAIYGNWQWGDSISCGIMVAATHLNNAVTYVTSPLLLNSDDLATVGVAPLMWGLSGPTIAVRGAVSVNGGATWISWDGVEWLDASGNPMTDGLRIPTEGYQAAPWLDCDGNAIESDGQAALRALMDAEGVALDFRARVYIQPLAVQEGITGIQAKWTEASTKRPLVCGRAVNQMGGPPELIVAQVDPTTSSIIPPTEGMPVTYEDVVVTVWTTSSVADGSGGGGDIV